MCRPLSVVALTYHKQRGQALQRMGDRAINLLCWQGRKLFIVGTTSSAGTMSDLGIMDAFNVNLHVPSLKEDQIRTVFQKLGAFAPQEASPALPDSWL